MELRLLSLIAKRGYDCQRGRCDAKPQWRYYPGNGGPSIRLCDRHGMESLRKGGLSRVDIANVPAVTAEVRR